MQQKLIFFLEITALFSMDFRVIFLPGIAKMRI